MSDKNETVFWESEAKHSKDSNLVIGRILENGFEATVKNEFCEPLKKGFVNFL